MRQGKLPQILLTPHARRLTRHCLCFQLVLTESADPVICVQGIETRTERQEFQLGQHCFLYVLTIYAEASEFPTDTLLRYQLELNGNRINSKYLAYEGDFPGVVIPDQLEEILHGSCRNPHHESRDSFVTADEYVKDCRERGDIGPQLLLMSGDQIYADDVAGPMLLAIAALSETLGLYADKDGMLSLPVSLDEQLYQRHLYLPKTPWQQRSKVSLGYWLKQDEAHFTSMKSGNHLISLSEFIALYLLTWSPIAWSLVPIDQFSYKGRVAKLSERFNHELVQLKAFVRDLVHTQRLFANVSCMMMFDDHDVTDDWNLTAKWEAAIHSNEQSRRIIDNGLTSYWLFQGLGNDATQYSGELISSFYNSQSNQHWCWKSFSESLLRFNRWHYCLSTTPKVVVLDTRTHRWRNDQDFNEPSGLLDWDRLLDLEKNLVSHSQVIIVSPAPVFGVKAIEAIQAVFNACGEPLMVDVENWMAHEGAAKKLLDIFRRSDTPNETIILSGDVHYSFCFSVKARFGKHDNRIWQLTASGIKNEFPKKLINLLDKLDSWLYAPYSPLNLFTKRWKMNVGKHETEQYPGKYLISDSSISLITLREGKLEKYQLLHGNGRWSSFNLD